MLDNIYKVWNTVRYMTSRQWKYRLYYTARNRLSKRYPHSIDHPVQPRVLPGCYAVDIGNEDISLADGILNSEIPTVSGKKVLFCGDWDLQGEEYRLVSFKLNSFRWLLDLSDAYKATGERKYIEKGFEFINDWTCKCGHVISGDKWNPYVIAERITNWIGFCSQYGENTLDRYAEIIYPQAAELASSLEYQLGANHLLSEAKALICAGVFLEDEQFYQTGKSLLIKEVEEQFLPDGGHYERSVSYHVESLQQLFESWVLLKGRNDPDATRFVEYMKDPYQFLNGMIGKNGAIPLFNDAAYDYPFYDAADFLATASYVFSVMPPNAKHGNYSKRWSWLGTGNADITWEQKTIYPDTGLVHYPFEVGSEKYSFYMDCGDCGPDYNLGHAHADALSILLASEKGEVLVDSGVFTYMPGAERDACRATRAHNTVEINGANSAEVWAAFRVARRGHTKIVSCSVQDGLTVTASHDGYVNCTKPPVIHSRTVQIRDGKILILDQLNGDAHTAVSRFHVAPGCHVTQIAPNRCRIGNITVESERELKIEDCKVARMFGVTEAAKCINIDFGGAETIETIFSIIKE